MQATRCPSASTSHLLSCHRVRLPAGGLHGPGCQPLLAAAAFASGQLTTAHERKALLPSPHDVIARPVSRMQRLQRLVPRTFADPAMEAPDVDDLKDEVRWDPRSMTAVVVGAGPTGALATHYLARRGYRVEVHDQGQRPSAGDATSRPLLLTSRGAVAFEELELQLKRAGPSATALRGVWDMASADGKPVLRPSDVANRFRRQYIVDRSGLAEELIAAAEATYPDTVNFHFGSELSRAGVKNRTAVFRAASTAGQGSDATTVQEAVSASTGIEAEVQFDLLVGADGVDSKVRSILKAKVKDFDVVYPATDTQGWTAFHHLPPPQGEPVFGFATHRPQEYLYTYSAPGKPTLELFKDVCGRVSGTVRGLHSSVMGDAEAVAKLLTDSYSQLPQAWAQAIGKQVSAASRQGAFQEERIVQCNQFYGPRIVLVGDAAHAVTSAMAQGPSSAVESVRTLALVLRGAGDDLDKVPEVYSNVRGDAVMAMQMMEFMERTKGQGIAQLKFASWWFAFSARLVQAFWWLCSSIGSLLAGVAPGRFLTAQQIIGGLVDRRTSYSDVIKMLQGYAAPPVMLFVGAVIVCLIKAYSGSPVLA